MYLSDKVSAIKQNAPRTSDSGSGDSTASREVILLGTHDLPHWWKEKIAYSVEHDRTIGTGVHNKRKSDHMTECMSHTRLPTMNSGISATTITRHVANQSLNFMINMTRPYLLPLRVLLPKVLPYTQMSTRYNWTLRLTPLFLHPTLPKNNGNQSWLGSRETRGGRRWWDQWLLEILNTLPGLWCLAISPVPNLLILFNNTLSVVLLDSHHLILCPTVYRSCMVLTHAPLGYWQLGHFTYFQSAHNVLKNLFKWI